MNLLAEFEKRYTGNPADTMAICESIARDFSMDTDEVADYIYINRYSNDESLEVTDDEKL